MLILDVRVQAQLERSQEDFIYEVIIVAMFQQELKQGLLVRLALVVDPDVFVKVWKVALDR